jgi:hypothetical protein
LRRGSEGDPLAENLIHYDRAWIFLAGFARVHVRRPHAHWCENNGGYQQTGGSEVRIADRDPCDEEAA